MRSPTAFSLLSSLVLFGCGSPSEEPAHPEAVEEPETSPEEPEEPATEGSAAEAPAPREGARGRLDPLRDMRSRIGEVHSVEVLRLNPERWEPTCTALFRESPQRSMSNGAYGRIDRPEGMWDVHQRLVVQIPEARAYMVDGEDVCAARATRAYQAHITQHGVADPAPHYEALALELEGCPCGDAAVLGPEPEVRSLARDALPEAASPAEVSAVRAQEPESPATFEVRVWRSGTLSVVASRQAWVLRSNTLLYERRGRAPTRSVHSGENVFFLLEGGGAATLQDFSERPTPADCRAAPIGIALRRERDERLQSHTALVGGASLRASDEENGWRWVVAGVQGWVRSDQLSCP